MKKRFVTLVLALVLACSLAIPVGAVVAQEPTTAAPSERIVLELEYMDFYENQDYYMSLVRDKDYTLHFDVPEEYQELEDARQAENGTAVQALVPGPEAGDIVPYGPTVPTVAHNISTQGTYSFNGEAAYTDLYTNRYFIGSAWYIVTVNNHNHTNELLTVTAYNVISKGTMAYKEGTTIEKYTMSGTGATANTKHFYLKFHAPVNVTGTIARG